jgi:putative membrane protein
MFVREAGYGGNDEIALSKIAIRKSNSPTVRNFAAMMVAQHSQAGAKLKMIAASIGIRVPDGPDPAHWLAEAKLNLLKGAGFNHAYLTMMVKDHSAADHVFQMGTTVNNDKLRNFALETLPVVENHLKMATELELGKSSRMAAM